MTVFSPRAHGWTLPGWGRQTDCSLWGLQPSTAFSLPGARATQSNHRGRRNDIAVPCATANRCTNSGFGEARSAPSGDGAQARYRRAGQAQERQSGAYGETPRTNLVESVRREATLPMRFPANRLSDRTPPEPALGDPGHAVRATQFSRPHLGVRQGHGTCFALVVRSVSNRQGDPRISHGELRKPTLVQRSPEPGLRPFPSFPETGVTL